MRYIELYEDVDYGDKKFSSLSYNDRRNILRTAERFANAIISHRRKIEELDSFMDSKNYNDDIKKAFKLEVEKILDQQKEEEAVEKEEVKKDDSELKTVPVEDKEKEEKEEKEVTSNAEPAAIPATEPSATAAEIVKKSRISKELKSQDILNPEGMTAAGWKFHSRNNIDSALNTSSRTGLVKSYIKDKKGFVWKGSTFRPIGIWSLAGKNNKVVLEKLDDHEHHYLLGEAVVTHAVKAKGEQRSDVVPYLQGMLPIMKVTTESEVEISSEDLNRQNKLLLKLDMLDKKLLSHLDDEE